MKKTLLITENEKKSILKIHIENGYNTINETLNFEIPLYIIGATEFAKKRTEVFTEKEMTQTRNSRESEQHAKNTRRQPWRPVRKLETPPPPEGYEYRWIRESMLGQEDKANVSRRIREGWELVRGTDLPSEFSYPTADEGRHAGLVYSEGLLLAKIPIETKEERNAYYEDQTRLKKEALDNNMFTESRKDGRYIKYDSDRKSNVTFGKK